MAKFKAFEDIEAWKLASRLCMDVYRLTNTSGFGKDWALRDQMRKCAVSIPSNIAEGFERNSDREFAHFLTIAKGSAGELRTQLYLAKSLGYLDKKQFEELLDKAKHVSSQIANLIRHLRKGETS